VKAISGRGTSRALGGVLAAAALLALAPAAQAGAGINRPIFKDCEGPQKSCGPSDPSRDMQGPTGFGNVHYGITGGQFLLKARVENALPNLNYNTIVWCGPTHANEAAFVTFGVVNTDASGDGTVTLNATPLQMLACGPPGTNVHGHVDFDAGSITAGQTLVAARINFKVPGP
jgi:hypothetical protein